MWWLARWTSDLEVGGLTPIPCHHVVSSDKKLYRTLSLSTQVYEMGTGDVLLGVTLRWTSIPSRGGVAVLSVASCYRNRDKLRPRGPPWLVCYFTISCKRIRFNFFRINNFLILFLLGSHGKC